MKITAELLTRKGACKEQVDKFCDLFPEGVEPTRELCIAHANDFDWRWAAEHLLSASAAKAYEEACAPAVKAYNEARASAAKAYDEALASAWFDAWTGEQADGDNG